MGVPDTANQRWNPDFVSDAFTDGRGFRILTVVDDFPRENVALIADTSLSGARVVRDLRLLWRLGAAPTLLFRTMGPSLPSRPS